jgi:hypothetical protein
VKKEVHADSRRKGIADCLIDLQDLAPIDQRFFSTEIRVKKKGFTQIALVNPREKKTTF